MKYSIVMPYINRATQLWNTLLTYRYWYSNRNDYEIIIVEDIKNSEDISDVLDEYSDINIRHLVYPENNMNPCCHFNYGVDQAIGKYVVLTNTECCHFSNVLKGFDEDLKKWENAYIVTSCYKDKHKRGRVNVLNQININRCVCIQDSKYNKFFYHWCSVISKKLYQAIGGFDEDFKHGFACEDDEFVYRIQQCNFIQVRLRDDLKVVHLEHDLTFTSEKQHIKNMQLLRDKTNDAFGYEEAIKTKEYKNEGVEEGNKETKKVNIMNFNTTTSIPKILHLYWGKNQPLSYLRFLTVASWVHHNPDWRVIIGYPTNPKGHLSEWKEQNKVPHTGKDYWNDLSKIDNVTLYEYSWENTPWIKSEVHRSDVYRWDMMLKMGGWWSDFDILYINPMFDISEYNSCVFPVYDCGTVPIGFFGCPQFSFEMKNLYDRSIEALKNNNGYQAAGTNLIKKENYTHWKYISKSIVYPFMWDKLSPMLSLSNYKLPPDCIGIHWFGGALETHEIDEKLSPGFRFDTNKNFHRIVMELTDKLKDKGLL